MLKDLRVAVRSLIRNRGLTLAALLTLALAIGASTAIYSVVDALLLRGLPFHDSDRLVRVYADKPSQDISGAGLAPADFFDFRERLEGVESLGAYRYFGLSLGRERPRETMTILVTAGLLGELATPLHGRTFLPEEGEPGQGKAVVASYAFFRSELGADAARVGEDLILEGEPYRLVGVMGPDFEFPDTGVELWAPWTVDPSTDNRRSHWWSTVGKLASGVTIDQAQAELSRLTAALEEEFPDSNEGWDARLVPLQESIVGRVRPALLSLLIAVGMVLLIACANIANLLLARGLARQGELALRASLGASRGRLIRQLLIESLTLAAVGGVLGIFLARLGLHALVIAAPDQIPRLNEIGLDGRVLTVAALTSLVTGLLFGILPALRLTGRGLANAVRDSGRGTEGGGRSRLRSMLAVAQLALSLLLLIGAGLMLRSFTKLVDVDPGFTLQQRLAVQLFVYGEKYSEPETQRVFFERLFDELRAIPGVESVAGVNSLPMGQLGSSSEPLRIAGRPEPEDRQIGSRIATRGYFETMEMRLLAGRVFGPEDRDGGVPVVVLNESAARQYFRDSDPIGEQILLGSDEQPVTIIGVVGDVRTQGMESDPVPELYSPYEQSITGTQSVVIATSVSPETLTSAIEEKVWTVDAAQPIWRIVTFENLVAEDTAQSRFYAWLISLFAFVAVAIAAVGLYGVIAYSVAQRTREFGIRMAIGAQASAILKRVLRDAAGLITVGLTLGLLLGLVLTVVFSKFFTDLLFEVSPTDPPTFVGVAVVLALVGAVASLVPAARASRIHPIQALHHE